MKKFFVRESKTRHLFGQEAKPELRYSGLKLKAPSGDHSNIKANGRFFAVNVPSGAGAVALWRTDNFTKGTTGIPPVLDGHVGGVGSFEFNPFADNVIATGGDDGRVLIWVCPEEGLTENMNEAEIEFKGHHRKVTAMKFHPSANNVLMSGSADGGMFLWDVVAGRESAKIDPAVHGGVIQDLDWNYDGSLCATACRDKILRVFDPRNGKITNQVEAHEGVQGFSLCCLGNTSSLVTCGFRKDRTRQARIWDIRNLTAPLQTHDMDQATGAMIPMFDEDTNSLYLAGKGDTTVRVFEIIKDAPYLYPIVEQKNSTPTRGMCMLPKRVCDISRCEVTRLFKLETDAVVPISFFVPRRVTEVFQADLYPDCRSGKPAQSADEFFYGTPVIDIRASVGASKIMRYTNKGPHKMSLKPNGREGGGTGGGGGVRGFAKSLQRTASLSMTRRGHESSTPSSAARPKTTPFPLKPVGQRPKTTPFALKPVGVDSSVKVASPVGDVGEGGRAAKIIKSKSKKGRTARAESTNSKAGGSSKSKTKTTRKTEDGQVKKIKKKTTTKSSSGGSSEGSASKSVGETKAGNRESKRRGSKTGGRRESTRRGSKTGGSGAEAVGIAGTAVIKGTRMSTARPKSGAPIVLLRVQYRTALARVELLEEMCRDNDIDPGEW